MKAGVAGDTVAVPKLMDGHGAPKDIWRHCKLRLRHLRRLGRFVSCILSAIKLNDMMMSMMSMIDDDRYEVTGVLNGAIQENNLTSVLANC